MESTTRSGRSIPDDILKRIGEHRPDLMGYIDSLDREDTAQEVERNIANMYLAGESRLSEHETKCLRSCTEGLAYGANAGHSLPVIDEGAADRGVGRPDRGASERIEA